MVGAGLVAREEARQRVGGLDEVDDPDRDQGNACDHGDDDEQPVVPHRGKHSDTMGRRDAPTTLNLATWVGDH